MSVKQSWFLRTESSSQLSTPEFAIFRMEVSSDNQEVRDLPFQLRRTRTGQLLWTGIKLDGTHIDFERGARDANYHSFQATCTEYEAPVSECRSLSPGQSLLALLHKVVQFPGHPDWRVDLLGDLSQFACRHGQYSQVCDPAMTAFKNHAFMNLHAPKVKVETQPQPESIPELGVSASQTGQGTWEDLSMVSSRREELPPGGLPMPPLPPGFERPLMTHSSELPLPPPPESPAAERLPASAAAPSGSHSAEEADHTADSQPINAGNSIEPDSRKDHAASVPNSTQEVSPIIATVKAKRQKTSKADITEQISMLTQQLKDAKRQRKKARLAGPEVTPQATQDLKEKTTLIRAKNALTMREIDSYRAAIDTIERRKQKLRSILLT